ncbi:MAG TPA: hypothetical protein DCZ04_08640 [Syntrophorhabdus aromaticivorans]|nr:hypothetical protein [Syntrophorhabdus aromaticivorans]
MINNASSEKWNRLEHKNLDQQFMNEISQGLNCSPFEARAVLNTVWQVFGDYFDTVPTIKPGQMRLQVLSIDAEPGCAVSESKQIMVTITVYDEKEYLNIRQKEGLIALRRHRIQRVCREAFEQGGLLTIEDLAYRIFNCGETTICRDLAYFRRKDIFVPLRSTVKDIGRTLSHRVLIIKLWAQGKRYAEISERTSHSLYKVRKYVNIFKEIANLARIGYDGERIASALRISPLLVKSYLELLRTLDIVDHRKRQLQGFVTKEEVFHDRKSVSC